MIEYIKGALTDLTPALAVVEAAGVGYALNISLSTYTKIQGQKDVKLYVHEAAATTVSRSTALPRSRSVRSTACSSPSQALGPTRHA